MIHIAFERKRVGIRCGPVLERQVKEFFGTYYTVDDAAGASPDVTVDCVLFGNPGRRAVCSDIDVFLARPSAAHEADGVAIFRRAGIGMYVIADRSRRSVLLVGESVDELNLQLRLILRDQVIRPIEQSLGWISLHASVVEKNGEAVAFLGSRNNGKTTSQITMMLNRRCNFTTSDRIKVKATDDREIDVFGNPARCNIHAVSFAPGQTLSSITSAVDWGTMSAGKVLLDPVHLARSAGVGITPRARLKYLVLPMISKDPDPVSLTYLRTEQDIFAHLSENLLSFGSGSSHEEWLGLLTTDDLNPAATLQRIAKSIARDEAAIIVRAGYDNYVRWVGSGGIESALGWRA